MLCSSSCPPEAVRLVPLNFHFLGSIKKLENFCNFEKLTFFTKMGFLPDSLKEALSKLSEDQKEEIDVIESIVNTNETNKENTKEKVFRFVEKRKPENCINFILGCLEHASQIRPKERESILFFIKFSFQQFRFNLQNLGLFLRFRKYASC